MNKISMLNKPVRFVMRLKKIISYVDVEEGAELPRFYLPVYNSFSKLQWEAWPVYIAVFLLPVRIIKTVFLSLWCDLTAIHRDMRRWHSINLARLAKEKNS